ncbi:MAG: hypothetical protein ACAH11_05340 [Sphingomonas sp.]
MKTIVKMILGLFAVGGAAGTAHAQGPGGPVTAPPPPPSAGQMVENPEVRNGGDTYNRDAQRARDDAIARERGRGGSSTRGSPAKPEDVVAGAEVRDPKGVVVGRIESVSVANAVVVTEVGSVQVPLEAFGKNAKGLLIPMSKKEFDVLVAEANKPK